MEHYRIILSPQERARLQELTSKGRTAASQVINALILLACDRSQDQGPRKTSAQIAQMLGVSQRKIDNLKRRCVQEGLESVLVRKKPRREYARKIDGELEARLIALSCGPAPEGHARWTLKLLAERAVELEYVDSLSSETVRRAPKKNELKPWRKVGWVIPPKASGEFVAAMEQVLDVYSRPHDPAHPVVCMDETPRQLIRQVREPFEAVPGHPEREDYEYERAGTCNVFVACEPLAGRRIAKVTEYKKRQDWALFLQDIAQAWSGAERITLVMDNLNTHSAASLYETFMPEQAKALRDRFEFVYTPKHGSWLNMAEIEINVLVGQCLDRRLDSLERMRQEVAAWQQRRNQLDAKINWQFTTRDARVKLRSLYPQIEVC
ncbi:IS630 family transposase [Azotobacter beijerinckii]|uniref:IS630 family transposase n=1 Tax=Azotobacter beijerinckii TaxID=170623 RepID=UPI002952ACAD|nr:IS630 family transposase [Azotobacter beijerinckii]MDV7210263.1 IS630 family transposase [Azotobacter beijerinckii]